MQALLKSLYIHNQSLLWLASREMLAAVSTPPMASVFSQLDELARNPITGLWGLFYFNYIASYLPSNKKICVLGNKRYMSTACGVANYALLDILHCPGSVRTMERIGGKFQSSQSYFPRFSKVISFHSSILRSRSDCFFTYSFQIASDYFTQTGVPYGGHCFTVIHYSDPNEQMHYRMVQQYVNEYTLQENLGMAASRSQ